MTAVKLTGIAVVVFDLDDTLYPEREFAYSGFRAVGQWLRQRMACPSDPAERLRDLFDTAHRHRVFNQLLAEWGCADADIWLPQMIECYRTHEPVIQLYPDASAAIERWSGIFQLALISDGPISAQRNKIKALGLVSRLRPIILTDEWGEAFRKPHRRGFETLQAETGLGGSKCVYIGDNQSKDFIAPRQLGWRTICVQRVGGIYRDALPPEGGCPEYKVSSLDRIELCP